MVRYIFRLRKFLQTPSRRPAGRGSPDQHGILQTDNVFACWGGTVCNHHVVLGRIVTVTSPGNLSCALPLFVLRPSSRRAQSGCIETMCRVLDKNNRTNTWQRRDACVVEQCLSALALHVHRRPEVRLRMRTHKKKHKKDGRGCSLAHCLDHH